MTNHLAGETSPYLLQHAENPVDWYPWDGEALSRAKSEDKPIFLSIGYAACHWCHVMAHESFEDPQIASILNQYFVTIKVDREERPDLDAIFMAAVQALTGQGGWPMSVFLTPDGKPFYAGAYFPPQPRGGLPSFRALLEDVIEAWREQRKEVDATGEKVAAYLRQALHWEMAIQPISGDTLRKAVDTLTGAYDWQNGGWGSAPKFPQAMAVDFLLAQASRGDRKSLQIARHALNSMMRGGMYDLVGGGFHRYSTDGEWFVPHFEKMLYDNALLARAYLHAYLLTHEEAFRRVCEQTLDFISRELTGPEGQLYSSLDADTGGIEGATYLWTVEDMHAAIPDPRQASLVISAFGVSGEGHFDGKYILRRAKEIKDLAHQWSLSPEQIDKSLTAGLQALLRFRERRPQPAVDQKVLTFWNSLALISFAEAAGCLHRQDYLQIARHNAAFILSHLDTPEGLMHSWGRGDTRYPAFLTDVGALILGLLSLYEVDPDINWYASARRLVETLLRDYVDEAGGFFDTASNQSTPIIRPKEIQDNATPSGNALAVAALLRMAAFTGYAHLADLASAPLGSIQELAARYPTAFGFWLQNLDFALGPSSEIAIVGSPGPARQTLTATVFSIYDPRRVVAISSDPPSPESPPLLQGRTSVAGHPAAYVCHHFTCRSPVTDPEDLKRELGNSGGPG